jgi:hypothetical protein
MRLRERPPALNDAAAYIPSRRYYVDWLSEIGESVRLESSTVAVAVCYWDNLLQVHQIAKEQWHMLALCCLRIAAKFEEAEERVPTMSELGKIVRNLDKPIAPESLRLLEVYVLQRLGWELTRVTPLHVVGHLLAAGVVYEDDLWQGRPIVNKIPAYIKKYSDFFAALCLQEFCFQKHMPTLLAAAIVAAARRALSIAPVWREELTEATGYSEEDIAEPFDAVWNHYLVSFPAHAGRIDSSPNKAASPKRESPKTVMADADL